MKRLRTASGPELYTPMRLRNNLLILLMLGALLSQARAAGVYPVREPHTMVVSAHAAASQAGVEILKTGGNAVDAAAAVGFALAVVHPQAGNLGGGGFMLIRTADGKTKFIDYRETAPAAATADMYLDSKGEVTDAGLYGFRAIAIPSSVAGLTFAQKKYGKLKLDRVMAPAIKLARDGFALSQEDAEDFRDKKMSEYPEAHRIFQRDGNYYRTGEIFRQPELAHTLERLAKDPSDFYRGAMAREIAEGLKRGGGIITAEDLAHYEVKEREPVRGTYRGYEVISAPPPSSGGVTLIELLNILEGYDLAKLGNRTARSVHFTTEAFRRAFFDRAELLGDPDFSRIPVAQLIDKKYAAAWRETIDPSRATPSEGLRRPPIFSQLETYASVTPPLREFHHTTHFSVVDAEGNAVSDTTTLNDDFGSRVVVKGLGFLLNDEMDDFAAKPGVPNGFGLIQGPANAIGPGKRPLSAMAPTIVLKDGKLSMVLGSPGGPHIITTVANALMGVVDYGMDIQEAVNAPRFHQQWMPDLVEVEQWFPTDTVHMLEQMGYKVQLGTIEIGTFLPYWSEAECIAIDPKTGDRLGASDIRGNGKAVGY